MTKEQVGGIVRAVLAGVSGYLIGKGYDAALINEIAGAVGIVIVSGWSLWAKKSAPAA
ncbi:hypothetical protein Pan4_22 [Pseudanabaena phage Pan4]|nr:hypothetical protein Pan4_22 [Pseudanabaena phage Pan4]